MGCGLVKDRNEWSGFGRCQAAFQRVMAALLNLAAGDQQRAQQVQVVRACLRAAGEAAKLCVQDVKAGFEFWVAVDEHLGVLCRRASQAHSLLMPGPAGRRCR